MHSKRTKRAVCFYIECVVIIFGQRVCKSSLFLDGMSLYGQLNLFKAFDYCEYWVNYRTNKKTRSVVPII